MGLLYDEFSETLDRWRRKYAAHPEREMLQLFLLALEREQLVSVGYRESLMQARLRGLAVPDESRELMRHALLWAWKDEEMHAIYIRGLILKLGKLPTRLLAYGQQIAGSVGGWASSIQHHVRWSDAPASRALATGLSWAGRLTGKVPRSVRRQLRYGSFRQFCLFNVDAERTAALCWQRLAELAAAHSPAGSGLAEDFRRIWQDEENHRRVFEILAAALDEQDQLAGAESTSTLAEKLTAVGGFFLPPVLRPASARAGALATDGRVWSLRGTGPDEKLPLFRRILEDSGLEAHLAARAEALGKPLGRLRIAIKPTFMMGYHRKDPSTITDPALLDELARFLRQTGCEDLCVVEARNHYDCFYANRGVAQVAAYFDIGGPLFRLADASEEQVPHAFGRGFGQHSVSRTWKDADFRISFGKLRSHPVEHVHLCVANLAGLGQRVDEFLFTERQAHYATAIMMLLADFPLHFALLDGYDSAADGLLGVMGCTRPAAPRRLYASADALALDCVAARHTGLADPRESSMLRTACQWFGDNTRNIEVVGTDEPIESWRGPYHSEISTLLSLLAYPVYQYGSGRGALFVPEMDEAAFPPLGREGRLLRTGRKALRALLELRHPS